MVRADDFDRTVTLPPGLTIAAIRHSIEYIQRELDEWVELYYEQANLFSAIVGMYGTKALDTFSQYEKSRHADVAQQRFPDLQRRGASTPPAPEECLESKASKRPWALQAHYDHPGWYIVWRYLVDPTRSLESQTAVVIWRVDVVFLEKEDWKYEGSTAGEAGGGRTHTFGLRNPASKLRNAAVYRRRDVAVSRGKAMPSNQSNSAGSGAADDPSPKRSAVR
jgi:hypothetical protein